MRKQKKLIAGLSATALLIGAYFALSPIVLSNFLLYLPKRVTSYSGIPANVFGAKGQSVTFPASTGKNLHGFYFEKPGSRFTVLLHHGQGGDLETHFGLAKTILLAGFSVLIYDYEGFGMSPGTACNQSMQQDGEAAFKFLIETKHIKPFAIIECGVSLGSGVASHVAESHPCAAVILISPYISINQVAVERIPLFRCYPKMLFPQPDMGSLSFIRSNTTIPVLLIHGANDPIIGAHHAQELAAIAKSPHWLILEPKAHHGDFSTIFLADQIKLFAQRALPDRIDCVFDRTRDLARRRRHARGNAQCDKTGPPDRKICLR
jgi:pimeloyl-ACP methyl ester carboxylesterase